ncbi:MAG: hypothetical protein QNJ33_18345 [Crocosphaera sp.]|nr:hypothetical protein [Crocosphaera sp.]
MKKQRKDTTIQKLLLSFLTDNLKETLVWVGIVFLIYVFVRPNQVLLSVGSGTTENIQQQVTEVKTYYKTYPKILVFIHRYKNRGKGSLIAIDTEQVLLDGEWTALSGNGSNEDDPEIGPIPSQKNANPSPYRIRPQEIRFQSVEKTGYFYQISPITFYVGDVKRGGFAVYPNSNVPGTLQNIKLETDSEWDNFQALMRRYQAEGIKEIPLLVVAQ